MTFVTTKLDWPCPAFVAEAVRTLGVSESDCWEYPMISRVAVSYPRSDEAMRERILELSREFAESGVTK